MGISLPVWLVQLKEGLKEIKNSEKIVAILKERSGCVF